MDDKQLVAMFLFASLDLQVADYDKDNANLPDSLYDRCGVGAVEAARSLNPICTTLLQRFNPEHPFCDLLYTDCDYVAAVIVEYMKAYHEMPTCLYNLEISQCQTLN